MNQITNNIPAAIGAAFEGGYFVGIIKDGEQQFALVMAGAAGALDGRWNNSLERVADAESTTDGPANTRAMAAAGSKLAERALALEINGHKDWYIPAKDELELAYRNTKPTTDDNWSGQGQNANSVPPGEGYSDDNPAQTAVQALQVDEPDALVPGFYWSSTQHRTDSDYAWGQYFDDGGQDDTHKSYAGRVRVFRRLPI
jgi:hypothetical protein